MKKLFTRDLAWVWLAEGNTNFYATTVDQVVAEEDWLIHGILMRVRVDEWKTQLALGNVIEGADIKGEVTQAGMLHLPGSISTLRASSHYSVQGAITPNAIQTGEIRELFSWFPIPFTLREEGSVNLITEGACQGTVAIRVRAGATIYLTKANG